MSWTDRPRPSSGALVHVTAENYYRGIGLVLEELDDIDARRVLLQGAPALIWLWELEEVTDEV